MPKTSSILSTLKRDFPDIGFEKGDTFRWDPVKRVVFFSDSSDKVSLLHEVAHAMLGHTDYRRDIELLELERQAWDATASHLSNRYDVSINEDAVEDMLDTYRDWLHSRSLCPSCQATGLQTAKNHYACLACLTAWQVNQARTCALRRYQTK